MQTALLPAYNMIEKILASLPGAILIANQDGRVAYANPLAEQQFGSNDSRLVGSLVYDVLPLTASQWNSFLNEVKAFASEAGTTEQNGHNRLKGGRERYGERDGEPRRPALPVGERLQPRAPRRHDRQLGHREEAVQQDQKQDDGNLEQVRVAGGGVGHGVISASGCGEKLLSARPWKRYWTDRRRSIPSLERHYGAGISSIMVPNVGSAAGSSDSLLNHIVPSFARASDSPCLSRKSASAKVRGPALPTQDAVRARLRDQGDSLIVIVPVVIGLAARRRRREP